jgi:hypothetical protein
MFKKSNGKQHDDVGNLHGKPSNSTKYKTHNFYTLSNCKKDKSNIFVVDFFYSLFDEIFKKL